MLLGGLDVMVNYNISQPDQRGMWFNAKVEALRPLVCTVMAGVEQTQVPDWVYVEPDLGKLKICSKSYQCLCTMSCYVIEYLSIKELIAVRA